MVLWKIRPPTAVVNTMIESTRTNVARSMDEAPAVACFAVAALPAVPACLPTAAWFRAAPSSPPPARSAAPLLRPDHTNAA